MELILDVVDMNESYPFRDRFIKYYDLLILWRDMMNSGKDRNEIMLSNHMRGLINKYFNVLNKRIPSAFVNIIKFLELLFSILKDRINKTPETLNTKENRLIWKLYCTFHIIYKILQKSLNIIAVYYRALFRMKLFLVWRFQQAAIRFYSKHFYSKKIASLIKGTMKCFERLIKMSLQCLVLFMGSSSQQDCQARKGKIPTSNWFQFLSKAN